VSGPDRQPLTAAILVGGRSRRLGRDKALLPIGGRTLAERVRGAVAEVADRVVVVGKTGERNPLPDLELVLEDHPVRCALAGVVAALAAAGPQRVLVVGCDHPFLVPGLLRRIARLGNGDVRLVEHDGQLEPLLACWAPARALPALEGRLREGRLSLAGAIHDLEAEIVPEEEVRDADPELRSFININTPGDVRKHGGTLENY
jgi:molybdopterin-guanine dinucleotide biosynthesis protein B/molybdopterin-guanine dinucleotide biosynthesis protein